MQVKFEEKEKAIKLLSDAGLLTERDVERLIADLFIEKTESKYFRELCKQRDSRSLKFTIPIVPVAQKRARHAVRGRHACAYKHKDQRSAEQVLNTFLKDFQPEAPFEGPLVLGVRAYLPIPKSKPKKFKTAAQSGEVRPIVKPDMDNILKHIKDCMSQMRYWGDDKQVVEYLSGTGKYYSNEPRWEIELRPWVPDLGLLSEVA